MRFFAVEGPQRGQEFKITQARAMIGRADECTVKLKGKQLSRIHAKFEFVGDKAKIFDNESLNGVYVNGTKVVEKDLTPDDEVEIGEHILVFDPAGDPWARPKLASVKVVESLTDPFTPVEPDPRLPQLVSAAALLTAMEDSAKLARMLLNMLLTAFPSERGFVMLVDRKGGLKPAARKVPSGQEEFNLSSVLFHQVSKDLKSIIAFDTPRQGPNARKKIGILCAPLATKNAFGGLAYLESKLPEGADKPAHTSKDLRYMASLCAFAGTRLIQLKRIPPRAKYVGRSLSKLVFAYERECIVESLRQAGGDVKAAAELLKITLKSFEERLKAHQLVAGPTGPERAPKPPDKPPDKPPASDWKSVQV